jgi:F-type H+-transporting ATPase subunit gamma
MRVFFAVFLGVFFFKERFGIKRSAMFVSLAHSVSLIFPIALDRSVGAVRGMATEKQIFNQIVSTKNIRKITSSMKMVSAAKLKGDEARLATALPFNTWTTALCGEPKLMEDSTFEDIPSNSLIIPITSDKGLCGGVNSFITRGTRSMISKLKADSKSQTLIVLGEKGRSQMRRQFGEELYCCLTELQFPSNFAMASAVTSEAQAAGNFDAIVIVYNKFVNTATYTQHYKVIKPMNFNDPAKEEALPQYEFEPDTKNEVLDDLGEYVLTSQLYASIMDGAASEQSSRMAAMENASKNAGEMIDALTLKYNRARQTRITTELIEIISGASALEEAK